MTNKREFFFIVFLCAISMIIFHSSGKRSLMQANSLSAAPDKSEADQMHAGSSETPSAEEYGWEGVPSAENQAKEPREEAESGSGYLKEPEALSSDSDNSVEDAPLLISQPAVLGSDQAEDDVSAGAAEGVDAQEESKADDSIPVSAVEEKVEENVEEKKDYAEYNPASGSKEKKSETVGFSAYQNRVKEEAKSAVKIQNEKIAIYEANKGESGNNSGESAEVLESKIKMLPNPAMEEKWIEPVIGEFEETESGKPGASVGSKEEISGKENIISDYQKNSETRIISAFNNGDIAQVKIEIRAGEKKDSDGDGIADETELKLGSDPSKKDSDNDGFDDGVEFYLGYNPAGKGILSKNDLAVVEAPLLKGESGVSITIDSDNDGISDREEIIIGTDPFNSDSDSDGYADGEEFLKGYNPAKNSLAGDDKILLENPQDSSAPIAEKLEIANIERNINENKEQIILSGKADPDSFVAIYVFSDPVAKMIKTDSVGEWIYILDKALDAGEHTVYSAIVDSSGLIMAKSNPAKFLIEEIEAAPIAPFQLSSGAKQISIWNMETYAAIAIGAVILGIIGYMIAKEI